jgi:hypothetical protein
MAHAGGRPSKFRKNFPKLVDEYYSQCKLESKFPSHAGVASLLGCAKSQIYEWAKIYPEFQESLGRGNAIAEELLTSKALDETWNANYAKFLAVNCFGLLSEKTEQKSEVNFPTGISISFIGGQQS